MLIRVNAEPQHRSEIMRTADIFRAKVVDVSDDGMIIEATGAWNKVSAMIDLLKPFGIREIVRTGTVAIARLAEQTLDEEIAEMIAAAEA
jgi:acetolactate synthase-1/3 small subunit